jgi:adenosylmethionine-8-amino-7-oxononanoate aminotransferase
MAAVGKGINSSYLPFGALLINDKVYDGLKGEMLYHGHTHFGNPICVAAANATLKVIIRDKLVENAAKVGKHVRERFDKEFMALPNVGSISGLGLMLGFEVVRDKAARTPFDEDTVGKWQKELLQKGIYVRSAMAGYNSGIRFIPPINTSREEADAMLDILYSALADLK